MTTLITIIKTLWIALLLFALVVPIMASCAGTVPRIDGQIIVNFETEEKGGQDSPAELDPAE